MLFRSDQTKRANKVRDHLANEGALRPGVERARLRRRILHTVAGGGFTICLVGMLAGAIGLLGAGDGIFKAGLWAALLGFGAGAFSSVTNDMLDN